MSLFIVLLDVALLSLGVYNLYWQGQIDLRGGYATFQLILAGFFIVWFLTSGAASLSVIIFYAAFITLTVMAGTTGLTQTRVVAAGIVNRMFPYAKLTGISLTPVSLPDGRELVVAAFGISAHRAVRVTFKTDLQSLVNTLRPRVPASVPITVQQVQ
ncbi:hypothetical protein [Lacticaseibacillus suihuaensis]